MKVFSSLITGCLLMCSFGLFGQLDQTLGLFRNEPGSFNGYTMFTGGSGTYLVDNCGELVHKWQSEIIVTGGFYLLDDGSLLRSVDSDAAVGFNSGGRAGAVEMTSWDGDQLWYFQYAETESHMSHHDVEPLPNGNILILAWSYKTNEEVVQAGRDGNVTSGALWPTMIIEVEPIFPSSGNIVWEWHLWDHLIQDLDASKDNFGVVEEHPELMDINFIDGNSASADWVHANAIYYIEEFDQIAISSRHLSEIYVIDHSTTTEEAAGHTGGIYGKGGDFLYRWGNPESYRMGTPDDQQLFGQHDVSWIPGEQKFMAFNNGFENPVGGISSVDNWLPPMNSDGSYNYTPGTAFGPESFDWSYTDEDPSDLFSIIFSSARRLPNGNTLICEGVHGFIFEVNDEKEKLWSYQNPVSISGPQQQGTPLGLFNNFGTFRALRFDPNHPAFVGRDLIPQGPVELNPLPYDCDLITGVSDEQEIVNHYYNGDIVVFDFESETQYVLFSLDGKQIQQGSFNRQFPINDLTNGIYVLAIKYRDENLVFKLMKN